MQDIYQKDRVKGHGEKAAKSKSKKDKGIIKKRLIFSEDIYCFGGKESLLLRISGLILALGFNFSKMGQRVNTDYCRQRENITIAHSVE